MTILVPDGTFLGTSLEEAQSRSIKSFTLHAAHLCTGMSGNMALQPKPARLHVAQRIDALSQLPTAASLTGSLQPEKCGTLLCTQLIMSMPVPPLPASLDRHVMARSA